MMWFAIHFRDGGYTETRADSWSLIGHWADSTHPGNVKEIRFLRFG